MNLKSRLIAITFVIFYCAANGSSQSVWNWYNIAHLAVGGGLTSNLTIRDAKGTGARTIYIYLYDDNGSLIAANVSEGIGATNTDPDSNKGPYYGSSFVYSLPASQERTFKITKTGATVQGSVQMAADNTGSINASLRFTFVDGAGNATDVVGILPAQPNRNWTVAVEKQLSTDYTGIAIANPFTSPLTVTIDFYKNGQSLSGTRTFTINPLGHMAKFVHESALFGDVWNSFTGVGTLRISSASTTFVAAALRADGNQYSSLQADAGVWGWNVTFTGQHGAATWNWRFYDGFSFMGYEQNFEAAGNAEQKALLRGVLAWELTPPMFFADWIYASNDGTVQGGIVFQGVPTKSGGTDVINGTRTDLNNDGTVKSKVTFQATRIY